MFHLGHHTDSEVDFSLVLFARGFHIQMKKCKWSYGKWKRVQRRDPSKQTDNLGTIGSCREGCDIGGGKRVHHWTLNSEFLTCDMRYWYVSESLVERTECPCKKRIPWISGGINLRPSVIVIVGIKSPLSPLLNRQTHIHHLFHLLSITYYHKYCCMMCWI